MAELTEDQLDSNANKKTGKKTGSGQRGSGSDTRGFKMVFMRLAQFMSKNQFRLAFRSPRVQPAAKIDNAPTLDR